MRSDTRPPRAASRGGGFVQIILVLLVVGIVTLIALRMLQRAPLPSISPGSGNPARSVLQSVELEVEGMTSEADAAQVEEGLRKVPGVASVRVEVSAGTARVTFNPAQTNPDTLVAAVARSGFRARR